MAKAVIQTTQNENSVVDFIKTIPDQQKQADSFKIVELMQELSGFEPKMWGPAIIGFGTHHYKYESGREGDQPLIGFSPRKQSLSIYLSSKFDDRETLLKQFGKHTTSKACIYVKKLADIDLEVFKKMISNSVKYMRAKHN